MGRRPRIDGLKLSDELLYIRILPFAGSGNLAYLLYRHLADHEINVPFLSMSLQLKKMGTSCCVSVRDQDRVKNLIASDPLLGERVTFVPSVGMVSLFPHQKSMTILGCSLQAFGKAGLPLYGMGSSLSSLTFITEFARLGEAAAVLEETLQGPFIAASSDAGPQDP